MSQTCGIILVLVFAVLGFYIYDNVKGEYDKKLINNILIVTL